MASDVEVQDLSPPVLDHEEAVQELESQRWQRRYLETVRSETSKPSFRSSLRIFGAPQSEFSAAIVRMRARTASLTFGLAAAGPRSPAPVRAKARPMPSDHVSGFTRTKTSGHRGQILRRVA